MIILILVRIDEIYLEWDLMVFIKIGNVYIFWVIYLGFLNISMGLLTEGKPGPYLLQRSLSESDILSWSF